MTPSTNQSPRQKKQPVLNFAKFPPDDDEIGGGAPPPGGAGGGGFGDPPGGGVAGLPQQGSVMIEPGDGNFRRGKWIAPVIALLVVGIAAGGAYFAFKKDKEAITPQQAAKNKQDIFVKPAKEQAPEWKKWAASDEPLMEQEALSQLAYMDDADGIKLAQNALASKDHRIRGVAAQVLAYYGTPKADGAKQALLTALKEADESDEPQLVWALVVMKEPSVFTKAMELYRKSYLNKVQRLGGGNAFDARLLANLVSLDEIAKMADDSSDSVRQLCATILSENAEPKWTPTLVKLVQDKSIEVAREAATGLGKIGDEAARGPLLDALSKADKESRKKFLEAIRDGIGGEGLVLALGSVDKSKPQTEWAQNKQIFEMLKSLADPRSGDALVKWADSSKPHPHWIGEVGMRLAEIGDMRAAKYLNDRLAQDPKDIYKAENMWESDEGGSLAKGDTERMGAARMLADLSSIYPDKGADFEATAFDGIMLWTKARAEPSASTLRFLANIKSKKGLEMMRKWAFPDDPMPKSGEVGRFPAAFEIAQSGLRYIGKYKDPESQDKLLKQLKRKTDRAMDITEEGLKSGGNSVLGMTLRAVAVGASDGLSEWGDPKTAKPLMEFIEDETWNEEARQAACAALAWTSDVDTIKDVAKKTVTFANDKKAAKQFISGCYAMTLSQNPKPEVVGDLIDLLTKDMPIPVQLALAEAIGAAPLSEANVQKLTDKLKTDDIRNAAALSLIMGGDPDTAARTVAFFGTLGPEALNDLKDSYFRAFGFWSDQDLKRGNIFRWVDNAERIARVKLGETPQLWAIQRLQDQFDNLVFDNGPHSQTRIVLRYALVQMAKTGDDASKAEAIRTLKFMKEQGSLMALRREKGSTGEIADKAFREYMNPALVGGEDTKNLQAEQAKKMRKDK